MATIIYRQSVEILSFHDRHLRIGQFLSIYHSKGLVDRPNQCYLSRMGDSINLQPSEEKHYRSAIT